MTSLVKKIKTITNNDFCLNHPTNCLIIGKTSSGKTNQTLSNFDQIYIP